MSLNLCPIITENKEGYTDFNINPEWYKGRKPGISAVIRSYGEEQFIEACIRSILPLFDEVIVTLTPKEGDASEDIIRSIKDPKIKLLIYPFSIAKRTKLTHSRKIDKMMKPAFPGNPSVHSFSYYTNWGMAQTRYSHVADQWDADQILIQKYASQWFHDFILRKASVSARGYNIIDMERRLSKSWPYQGPEVRFFRINKYRYHFGEDCCLSYLGPVKLAYPARWYQFPVQQAQAVFNHMLLRDSFVQDPIFWHMKLIRGVQTDRFSDYHTFWKSNWGIHPKDEVPKDK
jgi:hypothetical protein